MKIVEGELPLRKLRKEKVEKKKKAKQYGLREGKKRVRLNSV